MCFNPRTHEGCDSSEAGNIYRSPSFQSTHPRGVRHKKAYETFVSIVFQSTHPRGVRLFVPWSDLCGYYVSIHAPTRGATHQLIVYYRCHTVSIHAPTRGATYSQPLHNHNVSVSIHAPTRGATKMIVSKDGAICSFNPRTHEGCDSASALLVPACEVSIHAPTRGATFLQAKLLLFSEFQSTHPRGVRQGNAADIRVHSEVSIHAPTRGATGWYKDTNYNSMFQSTHPRGVRPI